MEYKSDFLLVHWARAGDEEACTKAGEKVLSGYLSVLSVAYI